MRFDDVATVTIEEMIIGFIFGRMDKSQAVSHMRITGLREEKPRQL